MSKDKINKEFISILCPFYNEEDALVHFFEVITPLLEKHFQKYEIVAVNDGSTDKTLELLNDLSANNPRINVINLSRNFGKEAALTAALDFSKGDIVVPIDADLQDPPSLIIDMVEKWREGYDVVLAKRIDRTSDTILKRLTANIFYKLHNKISSPQIPQNVGDFRLMSREVVEAIKNMPERHRFMKGLFAWVGFKTTEIEYTRNARCAGKTKFKDLV